MKQKIIAMYAFFVILVFLSVNMSWAHDYKYRNHPSKHHGYDRGDKGRDLNHQVYLPLTKEQRRFERAKRRAWADGRLTYKEMRKLHHYEKKAIKRLHRSKHHRTPYHHKKRNHRAYRQWWYTYPGFSIMFYFSEPGSHIGGVFGVR